jgi:hypothetical protein
VDIYFDILGYLTNLLALFLKEKAYFTTSSRSNWFGVRVASFRTTQP